MQSHTTSCEKYQCFLSDGTSEFGFIALGFNWGPVNPKSEALTKAALSRGTPHGVVFQALTHLWGTHSKTGTCPWPQRAGNEHHFALDFCQPSALL